MKWFKHLTSARRDERLAAIIDECGIEGYGFYFMLLEVVGEAMDKSDRCELTYSLAQWSRQLYCHHHKVGKYLGKLQSNGLVEVEYNGSKVTVKIPKLLKHRDEYSKKSGHSTDKLRSKDKETEADTDTETDIPSTTDAREKVEPDTANQRHRKVNPRAAGTNPRSFASLADGFNTFWAAYPLKEDKEKAKAAWAKIRPDEALLADILAGIERARQYSRKWREGYIPHPTTWLNGRRWEDEFPGIQPGATQSGPPQMPPSGGPLITTNGGKSVFDLLGLPSEPTELTG